jgi:hypothetical protein
MSIELESLYFVIIYNLTHLQDGNTKVKFVLRILYKIYVGSETNRKVGPGYGSGSEKNHSGSTTLISANPALLGPGTLDLLCWP